MVFFSLLPHVEEKNQSKLVAHVFIKMLHVNQL